MSTEKPVEGQPRKGIYVGAPACFALEQACQQLHEAFCEGIDGIYVVGSALQRSDWRDVDVRMILSDEHFAELFPDATPLLWEFNARWLLMTVAISKWLASMTGLPIDFQFQPQTHANRKHKGPRSAIGLKHRKAREGSDD